MARDREGWERQGAKWDGEGDIFFLSVVYVFVHFVCLSIYFYACVYLWVHTGTSLRLHLYAVCVCVRAFVYLYFVCVCTMPYVCTRCTRVCEHAYVFESISEFLCEPLCNYVYLCCVYLHLYVHLYASLHLIIYIRAFLCMHVNAYARVHIQYMRVEIFKTIPKGFVIGSNISNL